MVFSATEDLVYSSSSEFGSAYFQTDIGMRAMQLDEARRVQAAAQLGHLERLENGECIKAYATPFPTRRGSLILVTTNSTPNITRPYRYNVLYNTTDSTSTGCRSHPYDWICHGNHGSKCYRAEKIFSFCREIIATLCEITLEKPLPCVDKVSKINPTTWMPIGEKVDYCLSSSFEPRCKLESVPHLPVVVVLFNAVKVLVLLCVWLLLRDRPLMSIGDAVSSFLTFPDETTKELSLMGKNALHL
jgi:hypothetical protein